VVALEWLAARRDPPARRPRRARRGPGRDDAGHRHIRRRRARLARLCPHAAPAFDANGKVHALRFSADGERLAAVTTAGISRFAIQG